MITMRKTRLFIHEAFEGVAYHVMSRVTQRQMLFGEEEKAMLVSLMRRYERFSGLKVLTYCVMGNHFHWLVEVPQRPADADLMPDDELVNRVRWCRGRIVAKTLEHDLKYARERGHTAHYEAMRGRWLKRMWNLSAFVQSVKQRFSVWYNKRNKLKGTLWEERFKCVIAMGPEAIASIAAYIDLNPVRAELVDDPKDYAWSGYGEAMSGGRAEKTAREGLKHALCGRQGGFLDKDEMNYLEWYRRWIYGRGLERGQKEDGKPMKRGFEKEKVVQVQEAEGRLPSAENLEQRVRHFSEGLVVGTKELVNNVFEANRAYFGPKRQSGARKIRGAEWGPLRSMRDLQVEQY